ncbi:MAG: hypothetical protein NC094_01320 [Bacteroidales bacterium]|nr:hypothetical protein [Lachnoclostridium sp.]MCM1384490.1 hypothetical protein [Lachnoclostridium sp.]MCM1464034.1 hypothetical protein [Bacteroidales bacterium]
MITVLLTLLCVANVLLLGALVYSGRGKQDLATQIGFGYMAVTLIFDMVFAIGGVVLW